MHAGKFDELVQQFADLFAPGAAHQRQTQRVDGIHQDAVLIVHGPHAHRAGVVPGKKRHMGAPHKVTEELERSGRAKVDSPLACSKPRQAGD